MLKKYKKLISLVLVLCVISITSISSMAADPEPTVWYNHNLTVGLVDKDDATATTTDGKSGTKELQYQYKSTIWNKYSTDLTLDIEGANIVFSKSIDNALNESSVTSKTFYIDKTNPTGVISGNSAAWTQSFTLNYKGSDALSGVQSVSFDNGSTWIDGDTTSKDITANGTYYFKTKDKAGNICTNTEVAGKIDRLKPNAPDIVLK